MLLAPNGCKVFTFCSTLLKIVWKKKSYNRSQGNGLIERKKRKGKQIERWPNPKCDIHKIFTINSKVTSCYWLFFLLMDKKSFKWWIQIRTKIFRVGLDREVGL